MHLLALIIFCSIILLNVASLFWFAFNATAFLQRGMDIIGTSIFWMAGFPLTLISIIFILLIIKGWNPNGRIAYLGIMVLVLISILLSGGLIKSTGDYQWTKTEITSDAIKVTTDNKYEYRMELVNLFQRNAYARLYLKNTTGEDEFFISINIELSQINGISVGEETQWVVLEPTVNPTQYILYTTKDFPISEQSFNIDLDSRTSRKMN